MPAFSMGRLRALLPWLLAAGIALPAAPAWAFLTDSEVRKQVVELKAETTQSLNALTQRVESMSQNQLNFANQTEALRADLARLVGQIEMLTHSLESAQKRQQDFYVDLDNRLRQLESLPRTQADTASGSAGDAAASAVPPADPQAEMQAYEAALGYFRTAKYKEAQGAFEGFIAAHPHSSLLPNAHYWLGSSLHQQRAYDAAANAFGHVATTWPDDPKAPDALLAQANALVGAKDVDAALKVLQSLVEKYPTNPAVETARSRIKTLAPKKKR
jgi:tol-pal system protein YbgF